MPQTLSINSFRVWMERHLLLEASQGTCSLFLTGTWQAPCLFSGGQRVSVLPTVVVISTDTIWTLRRHLLLIGMLIPKQGTRLRSGSLRERSLGARASRRPAQCPVLFQGFLHDVSASKRQQLIQRRPLLRVGLRMGLTWEILARAVRADRVLPVSDLPPLPSPPSEAHVTFHPLKFPP